MIHSPLEVVVAISLIQENWIIVQTRRIKVLFIIATCLEQLFIKEETRLSGNISEAKLNFAHLISVKNKEKRFFYCTFNGTFEDLAKATSLKVEPVVPITS